MIQSCIIVSARGGMVLYRKDFVLTFSQSNLIGGLVAALVQFSIQQLGLAFDFLRLEQFSLSIASSMAIVMGESETIFCALFHDTSTDEKLGRLFAAEILRRFLEVYSERLASTRLSSVETAEAVFSDFSSQILAAIEGTVVPVLEILADGGLAEGALLLRHERSKGTDSSRVDWLPCSNRQTPSVLADLRSLLSHSDDLSEIRHVSPFLQMDFRQFTSLSHLFYDRSLVNSMDEKTQTVSLFGRVMIFRYERFSLAVVRGLVAPFSPMDSELVQTAIHRIGQVMDAIESIRGVSHR